MDFIENLIYYKNNIKKENELNDNYYDSTIEIYNFSFLMHFYVFMLNHLINYNPFQVLLFLTFLYSFLKYSCNYSISSFFLHPIWYKRFYNVALPQLITSVNNVLVLKNDNSLITNTIQTGCILIAINYNFNNLELSKSNNIRGIISFIVLIFKYMLGFW